MAEPLKYYPDAGKTTQTPQEALDALLQTLHRSGTLRALDGFFGEFADISEVVVKQMNGPRGRNLLGNLAVLATALSDSKPAGLERIAAGVTRALGALEQAAAQHTPGVFALLMLMRQADTRRGLYTMLRVLQEIGREFRPETEDAAEARRAQLARHAAGPQPSAVLP